MQVNGNKYRRKKGNQAGTMTLASGDSLTAASGSTVTIAGTLATTGTVTVASGSTLTQPVVVDLSEVVAAAPTINAADSGKTFYLNLAGGFANALPAPAVGLNYKFVIKTAPTTAYTVAATGALIHGVHIPADGTAGVAINGVTTLTLVANTAIIGDRVEIESDGTLWYVKVFTEDTDHLTVA